MIYAERYRVYIDRADAPEDSEDRRVLIDNLTKAEAIAYVETEEAIQSMGMLDGLQPEYVIWMERV